MAISEIEIRLAADIARLRQNMDEARRVVGGALGSIDDAVERTKKWLTGLAAGFTVAAFAGFIKNSIDAVDALNDLSVRSKIAIEDLAGLALAAKLGDSSLEGIAASISKLSVNIGKDADKFRALGVTATEPLEAFKQLSDIFKSIQDPQQRAAFGAEALGKSWQEAAVLLDSGSAGITELIEKGKGLSGVTAQSAKAIGLFNDKLDILGFTAQGVGAKIATGLLPYLDFLADGTDKAAKGTDKLSDSLAPLGWLFKDLLAVGGAIVLVFKLLGDFAGALASQLIFLGKAAFNLVTLDWDGFVSDFRALQSVGQEFAANTGKNVEAFAEWERGIRKIGTATAEVRAEIAEPFPDPFGIDAAIDAERAAKAAAFLKSDEIAAARKKAAADAEATSNKEAEAYRSTISALREKQLANEAEIRTGIALTESQKAIIKFDEEIKNGKLKLTPAHIAEVRALLDTVDAQARYLAYAKQASDAAKKLADERESAVRGAASEADALERSVVEFGKSRAAIEAQTLARLEDELAQSASIGLMQSEIDHLKKLIAERKRSVAAAGSLEVLDKQKKATEQANAEQVKFWESIDKTAHDTFVSIADGSKDAAQRLKDTFKNIFFDWLYQQTIKKWIISIGTGSDSGSLLGAIGGAISPNGGGATGGGALSNTSTLISAGKFIYEGFTKGFASTFGTLATKFGSVFGTAAAGAAPAVAPAAAAVAPAAGAVGSGAAVGAGGTSAAAGAASAVPIIGWIVAGILANSKFQKQGWDIEGQTGDISKSLLQSTAKGNLLGPIGAVATVGINAANNILKKFGLSDALASNLSGSSLWARAFGHQKPTIEAQGIQGTLGTGGFSGEAFANVLQKGGWFRSDKRSTATAALTGEQDKIFDDTLKGLLDSVKGFGSVLGVEASVLDGYSKQIKLTLTEDEAKNQELIVKLFGEVGNELATRLVPNIAALSVGSETASETLQRVAGDFVIVQASLDALGVTSQQAFGAVGVASLAAREQLVKFAGGADALAAQVNFFSQNFLTAAEQLAPIQKQVTEELAKLGYSQVKTTDDFKKAVLALAASGALATESGAKTYAALLALAPAFQAVTQAATEAQAAALAQRADLQKQLDALTKTSTELQKAERDAIVDSNKALYDQVQAAKAAKAAQDAAKSALEGAVSRTNSFVDSLKKFRSDLFGGSLSTATPQQKYEQARLDYDKAILAAKGGDAKAQADLAELATAFLEASKAVNASSVDYTADFIKVQADTAEALKWAKQEADLGQATLDAYNKANGILAKIDANTIAVADAIRALAAAGGFMRIDGSHAAGLPEVPRDGYIARLHKGEGVVDAQSMGVMRRYFGGASGGGEQGGGMEALAQVLREEIDALRTEARENTAALAEAVYNSNASAARTISEGAKTAAQESAWKRQSKQDANT